MRILVVHAFYRTPGGEDRYVEQLVELLGRGHDVELLSTNNDDLADVEAARKMLFPGSTARTIETAVERFRPDVMHVHNTYPSLGAAPHIVARRKLIPLVMTVHNHRLRCPNGYGFTEGESCRRCISGNHVHALLHPCFPSRKQAVGYATALWLDRFVRRVERSVDLFIAPSEYMAEQLRGWGVRSRIQVIRNFSEERPLSNATGDRGYFAGRLSSEKGLDVLLTALKTAGDPGFDVLGDGPLRYDLEEIARTLDLTNVRFHGRVDRDELARVIGEARYSVMPSLSDENAPLAVFESLSAGVPTIVTDRGGLPELGQTVVPAHDALALAEAIDRLRTDDDLHSSMAAAGRRFAAENLGPRIHLGLLESAYDSVMAGSVPLP